MKSRMALASAIVVACILFAPVMLQGQNRELLFVVDIPFDFVASNVHFPAGHYSFYHFPSPRFLLIENDARDRQAFVMVNADNGAPGNLPTQLVFHRYGKQYFLAEVTTSMDHEVHVAQMCREERQVLAKMRQSGERIVALK